MQEQVQDKTNQKQQQLQEDKNLLKYGGFDLLEATIDGAQNLNPDRKARKKIFLTESSKKSERDTLTKILDMWHGVVSGSEEMSGMVTDCEEKAEKASKVYVKNLNTALKETKELETAYRSMSLFYKNTEDDKIKNVTIMNADPDQVRDLDNSIFIDAVTEELKSAYDRLDLRDNYGILVVPGYLSASR